MNRRPEDEVRRRKAGEGRWGFLARQEGRRLDDVPLTDAAGRATPAEQVAGARHCQSLEMPGGSLHSTIGRFSPAIDGAVQASLWAMTSKLVGATGRVLPMYLERGDLLFFCWYQSTLSGSGSEDSKIWSASISTHSFL